MKWLTISQIKRRSETAKGALKVSYEHWCQLYQAKAKELRKALENREVSLSNNNCGLCHYYGAYRNGRCQGHSSCYNCLLFQNNEDCYKRHSLFWEASETCLEWLVHATNTNWWAWKRATKALRDKLKELMEESKK